MMDLVFEIVITPTKKKTNALDERHTESHAPYRLEKREFSVLKLANFNHNSEYCL